MASRIFVTALVGPLHHLIALPGGLDLHQLKRIAWRQYRANRLRTCLVLARDAAVYLSDPGELVGDVPRSTSPTCDTLLSCEEYAVSAELRTRQERLRAFVEESRALPSNQDGSELALGRVRAARGTRTQENDGLES